MEPAMPRKPAARMPAPDQVEDFTEHSPPPKRRPIGDPVPKLLVLPPGESLLATFLIWDKVGRVPEGSLLCEFVGTRPETTRPRVGYVHRGGRAGLLVPGVELTNDQLRQLRIISTLKGSESPNWFVILAPKMEVRNDSTH